MMNSELRKEGMDGVDKMDEMDNKRRRWLR